MTSSASQLAAGHANRLTRRLRASPLSVATILQQELLPLYRELHHYRSTICTHCGARCSPDDRGLCRDCYNDAHWSPNDED